MTERRRTTPRRRNRLTALAQRIINDPVVLAALASVEGMVLTGGMMLKMVKVLYDAGYLLALVKVAASSLGWWGLGKLLVRFIAYRGASAQPGTGLFIANCTVVVAQLACQLTQFSGSCGSGVDGC